MRKVDRTQGGSPSETHESGTAGECHDRLRGSQPQRDDRPKMKAHRSTRNPAVTDANGGRDTRLGRETAAAGAARYRHVTVGAPGQTRPHRPGPIPTATVADGVTFPLLAAAAQLNRPASRSRYHLAQRRARYGPAATDGTPCAPPPPNHPPTA